jgi:potassium-dependent mechanosensitive channel
MLKDQQMGLWRFGVRLGVGAVLLLASALASSAQNPLTQLMTGKPKPGQNAPANPTAANAPAPQTAQGASPPQAIPLPEVASQSEQLMQTINSIAASLPSQEELKAVDAAIADHGATLDTKRKEVNALLAGTPTSIELREQETYWHGFHNFSSSWRRQLLAWANTAQGAVDQLDQLEPQWSVTFDAYKSQAELAPLLDVIRANLTSIRKLRSQAASELQQLVKMQIAVGAEDQTAAEILARLGDAQQVFTENLLQRDSLPFWQLSARRQSGENPSLFATAASRWITIEAFAREQSKMLVLLLLVLAISLACAYRLQLATWEARPEDPTQTEALLLVRHWIALGVLAPLLVGYVLAPSAPVSLIGLVVLFSFFPILRLLAPLLLRRYRIMLYCLAGYYAFVAITSWTPLSAVVKREVTFAGTLALFVALAYYLRPLRRRSPGTTDLKQTVLLFGARLATGMLGASLAANLLGYVRLAQYLGLACIYSGFIGISMYTGTRVYVTLLKAGLSLPQAERLAVARLHRQGLLRWVPRILVWTAVAIWLSTTLDLLRIRDEVNEAVRAVLNFRIAGSAAEITLGSVLGFFLMLVLGYIFASTIRFLLREEVFSRFNLKRDVPDLIASTVYYLLLLLVFFTAVNAGGVELNKFTLLTGALGVGFGFGMQNIINNFVSGLILQYERPIHVNDVLEVEGYTGRVTRIGVRSSTLQTFQGAEVIIPNANFISGKVVNWTLTESRRRAELAVGVAYGTDPKVVLKILLDAANQHESVLTEPTPMAYFIGFGDSSLNFELHFWVMQDSNWYRVRSEIAMVVMKCLDDEGIEIPFPQRDLHLRTVPGGTSLPQGPDSAPLSGSDGSNDLGSERARNKTIVGDGS